jgi:hypothetical protein
MVSFLIQIMDIKTSFFAEFSTCQLTVHLYPCRKLTWAMYWQRCGEQGRQTAAAGHWGCSGGRDRQHLQGISRESMLKILTG